MNAVDRVEKVKEPNENNVRVLRKGVEGSTDDPKNKIKHDGRTLFILDCDGMVDLSSVPRRRYAQKTTTKALSISECHGLIRLDDGTSEACEGRGHYKHLEEVQISGCSQLRDISWLRRCKCLRMVEINCCEKIQSVEELRKCPVLEKLTLSRCVGLVDVNLNGFGSLVAFEISKCDNLRRIHGFFGCHALETLVVNGCGELKEVEVRTVRGNVEIIKIPGDKVFDNLEFFRRLSNLKRLVFCGFTGSDLETLEEDGGAMPQLKWIQLHSLNLGTPLRQRVKDVPGVSEINGSRDSPFPTLGVERSLPTLQR